MSIAIPDDWVRSLIAWSRQNSRVQSAYVFGSRVKGTQHPNSDLDFAVCLSDWPESAFTTWMFEAASWREQLAKLLPVTVHLEMAMTDDKVVWPALQEHGILIFDREISLPQ